MATDDRTLLTGILTAMSDTIAGRSESVAEAQVAAAITQDDAPQLDPEQAAVELAKGNQAAANTAPAGPVVDAPAGSVEQQVEWFLAGLRQHESGNRNVNSKVSSASGYYQYIDSTWGGYGGYSRAHLAPFAVQHQRAKEDAMRAFKAYGNWQDVAMAHFYPRFAGQRNLWHLQPGAERGKAFPGNPTGRDYVNSVISKMSSASQGAFKAGG